MRGDPFFDGFRGCGQAVFLSHDHIDDLSSACGQRSQFQGNFIGQRARLGTDSFGVVSDHGGDSPRIETEEAAEALPLKDREGRYGGLFGSTVHHAIGLVLRSSGMTPRDAVQRAAKLDGLAEHLEEAVADVARALDTLRAASLVRSPAADLQIEYPIAGLWTDGQLASGYIRFSRPRRWSR